MAKTAETDKQLAAALKTTPRSLRRWRSTYGKKCPPARKGLHHVADWIKFMDEQDLRPVAKIDTRATLASLRKQAPAKPATKQPAPEPPEPPAPQRGPEADAEDGFPQGSESDWRKKVLQQKAEKEEIENGLRKGKLLETAALEIPLGATFVAIANMLSSLPERLAPLVAGFKDVPEIMDIIRAEVEVRLTALNAADYIANLGELVASHVTEADTAGMDRASMLAAVTRCTGAVLRRIGQSAVATAKRPQIADSITGQTSDAAIDAHAAPVDVETQPAKRPAKQAKRAVTPQKKKPQRRI